MYKFGDTNFKEEKDFIKDDNSFLNLELDGFNGPLDLLLQLAQQKKLDITKISILALVNQYLDFIKKSKKVNLNVASDYLVMAAILAYIKSKLLLPSHDNNAQNDKELLPELLAFNLKRLKAMRETSEELFSRDLLDSKRFLKGRILDQAVLLETEYYCNKKSLLICFANIFNRKGIKNINVQYTNYYNIESALEKIQNFYTKVKAWFSINEVLPKIEEIKKGKKSKKIAFITTVAASLELARIGKILIKQTKECGEIFMKKK